MDHTAPPMGQRQTTVAELRVRANDVVLNQTDARGCCRPSTFRMLDLATDPRLTSLGLTPGDIVLKFQLVNQFLLNKTVNPRKIYVKWFSALPVVLIVLPYIMGDIMDGIVAENATKSAAASSTSGSDGGGEDISSPAAVFIMTAAIVMPIFVMCLFFIPWTLVRRQRRKVKDFIETVGFEDWKSLGVVDRVSYFPPNSYQAGRMHLSVRSGSMIGRSMAQTGARMTGAVDGGGRFSTIGGVRSDVLGERTMWVACPPGATPGTRLAATSPTGESIQVTVPSNIAPGQQFLVRLGPTARPSIASSVQILPSQPQQNRREQQQRYGGEDGGSVGDGSGYSGQQLQPQILAGALPLAAPALPVDDSADEPLTPQAPQIKARGGVE